MHYAGKYRMGMICMHLILDLEVSGMSLSIITTPALERFGSVHLRSRQKWPYSADELNLRD